LHLADGFLLGVLEISAIPILPVQRPSAPIATPNPIHSRGGSRLSRTLNDDDVFERLAAPVLIVHGLDDEIVLPTMSEHHASLIPHAKTSYYEGIGHSPFLEDPRRFNSELLAFSSGL
jgi:pimeloyl-ACP methyl ester carboxylesterase